jgi:DNA replication and repair protein RecF
MGKVQALKSCFFWYITSMQFQGLALQHFRNYPHQSWVFTHSTTVIVAPNASGKTSIIEAIYFLASGKSFRATEVAEMISFGQELARIKGKVVIDTNPESDTSAETIELDATLTTGIVQQKAVPKTIYSVNGVKRQKRNFISQFQSVVFRPEDMRLIEGSPSRRREFVDNVLSLLDRDYAFSHKTYHDALKRKNKLLLAVREQKMPATVLSFWDAQLLKHGQVLQEKRRQFFQFVDSVPFPEVLQIAYEPSIMSAERQQEYAQKEIIVGHALIGPHKDDFMVLFGEQKPIHLYGSRGQQRMAVLWLKLAEYQFILDQTQHPPLLLLDDILSELDEHHRQDVYQLLAQGQSILTTTEDWVVKEITTQIRDVEIMSLLT